MKCKIFNFNSFFKITNLLILMLCSVVGAGFVSGAEIYEVFVRFGDFWFVGVMIFFILMFVLSFKITLNFCVDKQYVKMYKINKFMTKNTFYIKNKIKSILVFFNVLLISAAMFSGLRVLLQQLFNHNYIVVFAICIFLVFCILFFGIDGLQKMDYIVFVFMLLFCVWCVSSNMSVKLSFVAHSNVDDSLSILPCISFASLYVFMNIVQLEPIFSEYNISLTKKKALVLSFSYAFILTLILCLFIVFLKNNIQFSVFQMPFLEYFSEVGGIPLFLFSVGLVLALVSSLLTSLVGVKRTFLKRTTNFNSSLFAVVLALLLSVFDFSFFVSVVYPLIGFINFVIFVFL